MISKKLILNYESFIKASIGSRIKINDIVIEFDANKLTNQTFEFFNMLQLMLEDSGQVGVLEFDIFKLNIKNLKDYSTNLIDINNNWYLNKLL